MIKIHCFRTRYAAIENYLNNRRTRIRNRYNQVFDCELSPIGRLMKIENSVFNYFWYTFFDNIDVFECRRSGMNSFYGGHFCMQLNKIIWNCLCLKGRYIYNNDDITFFSVFAVRAATHYHTWAWQTLIYGKECFILLL